MVRASAIAILAMLVFAGCQQQAAIAPDCAIGQGPCRKPIPGGAVALDITPRPVLSMREVEFSVRYEGSTPSQSVYIDLTMPGMDMGKNTIALVGDSDGTFRAKGIIVRCPSGNRLWKASVLEGERTVVEFLFEVEK